MQSHSSLLGDEWPTTIRMSKEEEYHIPLEDQSVFGAGIKRKRVNFITATSAPKSHSIRNTDTSPSDRYLSIVFNTEVPVQAKNEAGDGSTVALTYNEESAVSTPQLCEICKLPLDSINNGVMRARPHEASISHQVCLAHSYPPSHLDRNRPGLKYLSSYGWDPDHRLGLGATGEGIRTPIKCKAKNDTVGLGVDLKGQSKVKDVRSLKIVKLDAGKVRKSEERERKKGERLREMFYRNDDLEKYLGGG